MGNSILRRRRDVKVLFIGLDGAGKTTLLYRMKQGRTIQATPTVGYNAETIRYGYFRVEFWDVGTRDRTRASVKHYLPGTDALVFVVDSTDTERLGDAFTTILDPVTREPSMQYLPLLVLANKQDLDGAMHPSDLNGGVETSGHVESRAWRVFGVSAETGSGINKAVDWLLSSLSKGNKQVKLKRSQSEPGIAGMNSVNVSLDTRADLPMPNGETKRKATTLSTVVENIRRSVSRR